MYRKEVSGYIEQNSIDLQNIQGYETSGCRLKELLEDCRNKDLHVVYHNKTVEADWMLDIYKMITDRVHEELRVKQQIGIKRALEEKKRGMGNYGRPSIKLPPDFEKQLKRRIENQESLSRYCEELKMKKSTFYKWVKMYRYSWNHTK